MVPVTVANLGKRFQNSPFSTLRRLIIRCLRHKLSQWLPALVIYGHAYANDAAEKVTNRAVCHEASQPNHMCSTFKTARVESILHRCQVKVIHQKRKTEEIIETVNQPFKTNKTNLTQFLEPQLRLIYYLVAMSRVWPLACKMYI